MFGTDIGCEFLLKSLNFRAEYEVLRLENAGDGGVDFRLDLLVLGAKIEKWELQGNLADVRQI